MLTLAQKLRALRRVINQVMQAEADICNDPMNDYVGFDPPLPEHLYEPVAVALRQLQLSRADAVRALDPIIMQEAKHTSFGATPLAYYQSAVLHND